MGELKEGIQRLLNWYKSIKQKRTLKRQFLQLGPMLAHRFSRSEFYTFAQVQTTLDTLGIESASHFKGYAMFLDEASYSQNISSLDRKHQYHQVREDISNMFFNRSMKFDVPISKRSRGLNSTHTSLTGQQDHHTGGCDSSSAGSD